jgi:hypothetical protein
MPELRMSRATILLLLHAFIAWTGTSPFFASNLESASKMHGVPKIAFCNKDMGMSGLLDSNAGKLQLKTVFMKFIP